MYVPTEPPFQNFYIRHWTGRGQSSIIAELPNGEVEHCKGTEKQLTEPNEMMAGVSLVPSPTPSFSSLAVRTASDEKLGVGLGTRLGWSSSMWSNP